MPDKIEVWGEVKREYRGGRKCYRGLLRRTDGTVALDTDTCVHQADAVNRMDEWVRENGATVVSAVGRKE
jgi:hypothetical protein